jgi:mannose-6-phosphate isomerase-like protein (cupin superfamily)
MELKRYTDAAPFMFGDFELREMTPDAFSAASFAEIVVPIGADRTPRVSEKDHRMYVGLVGDIEFKIDEEILRLTPGDVLHIDKGETYGFHNGGYEEGRLLLIRVPGPALPGSVQP